MRVETVKEMRLLMILLIPCTERQQNENFPGDLKLLLITLNRYTARNAARGATA